MRVDHARGGSSNTMCVAWKLSTIIMVCLIHSTPIRLLKGRRTEILSVQKREVEIDGGQEKSMRLEGGEKVSGSTAR
jgi:hypothetical protein